MSQFRPPEKYGGCAGKTRVASTRRETSPKIKIKMPLLEKGKITVIQSKECDIVIFLFVHLTQFHTQNCSDNTSLFQDMEFILQLIIKECHF